VAVAVKEEVEPPSPESVKQAFAKATETVWDVAMMAAANDPETGEELVWSEGDIEPGAEDQVPDAEDAVVDKKVADKGDRGTEQPKERQTDDGTAVPTGLDAAVTELDDAGKKARYKRHIKAGQRFIKQGRYDKAIVELNEASRLVPGSFKVNHLLGVANYQRGRYKAAIPYLERAVRLRSTSAASIAMLGDAYQATGRRSKALDAYKKYLKLKPTGRRSDQLRQIIARYH
jgi:tetratricopeptide (TPR) repeat protein